MEIKQQRNAALAIALLLSCTFASKAQTTGTTQLNVILNPLLSITVNDASVDLTYSTLDDYQGGVSTAKTAHLTVSSLLPYTLKVKSSAATLPGTTTSTNTIDADLIQIELPTGGNNTSLGATPTPVTALSTTDQPLITNAAPALAKDLDVTYSISSDNTASGILGHPADTYSTTVTYTISNL